MSDSDPVPCTCETDGWCNACRDQYWDDEFKEIFIKFKADLDANPLLPPEKGAN
jgi:hypothetical protein